MSITLTHVRFVSTAKTHDMICHFQWRSDADGAPGASSSVDLVEWIDQQRGTAFVGTGDERMQVAVLHPGAGSPYLRAHANGRWTNALLGLPEF